MARRKAHDKKKDDFLKRLFDEPAGGKSPKSRPGKGSRPEVSRAQLLAVLEAGEERLEEGMLLDDALLAAYLDGALAGEEQVALEGLLARSADLRDQLAAAGAARAAALDGKATMPKSFIENFDAVPGPAAGKPALSPAAGTSGLPRWLASIVPGRRWAMAALPAIVAVVVVAVIGPSIYGPEEAVAPEAVVAGKAADKDMKAKSKAGKRRSKFVNKEKSPRSGSYGAGQGGRLAIGDQFVAKTTVTLDSDLRAALITMGLRQNRRALLKSEAAKPRTPMPSAKIAEETKKPQSDARADREKAQRRAYSTARKSAPRNLPARFKRPLEMLIEKNCPAGTPTCCESRRIDPKLLQRLLAGGPPLQKMTVVHLSSKSCLLTLPEAKTRK